MKEYVSKKEFPFVEIGTKFIYDKESKDYHIILKDQRYPPYAFTEEEMEELVKMGFVEEVEKSNPNPTPVDNGTFTLKSELPFARVGDPVERRYNNELGIWFWYVHNRNSDEDWILGCDLLIDKDKWIWENKFDIIQFLLDEKAGHIRFQSEELPKIKLRKNWSNEEYDREWKNIAKVILYLDELIVRIERLRA